MKWGHFIWNSSCHHIFRVDKLLLDNFFFSASALLQWDPPKHHSLDTETDYGITAESVCLLRYRWPSKAIDSAYWDQYTVLANSFSYTECSCPEKHNSWSVTSPSSWIRILSLQSMFVSPSEVIFYLARGKLWLIHHVKVLSFRSEHREHIPLVLCGLYQLSPRYRTESGFWSS